ncbi:MAG: hypothetical protein IPG45_23075 [Deltaproteobacteria bacterium]|jgi:hypothetical protein|nr:hypothetical protein [Deltaproteobacteria bacterium]
MALALAGLEIGCSDRVLEIPIQAEDQSLVMISQGPAGRSALACEVAIGCPNLDLGPEDWRVLTILYPQPLAEFGLSPGAVPLLPPGDPQGQRLPISLRAFAAEAEDPELRPVPLEASALYQESRYDPDVPCPSWSLRWSARAGSSDLISDAVSIDDRTVLVFSASGEIVRVQDDSSGPELLNQTQPVLAATRGKDGTPYVLAQDQRIYSLTADAELTRLEAIPAVPQPIDPTQDKQVSLAADGPSSVYVQIVGSLTMGAQTSTVWHFDGSRWSIPYPTTPETPLRLGQNYNPEALVRGLDGEALSTKMPAAPLAYLTQNQGLVRVRELLDTSQVYQVRRLPEDQILVVGRLLSEEGRIQVGTLLGGGEISWSLNVPLIGNAQWRCSESKSRGFLCYSGEGDTTFIGGPDRCRDNVPPWVKGTRRTHPMGEGWLVEVRDNITGIEALHLLSLR